MPQRAAQPSGEKGSRENETWTVPPDVQALAKRPSMEVIVESDALLPKDPALHRPFLFSLTSTGENIRAISIRPLA